MKTIVPYITAVGLLAWLASSRADGPADNQPGQVRRVPPLGVEPSPEQREALSRGLQELSEQLQALNRDLAKQPNLLRLIPDVEVFYNAARFPFEWQEFQKPPEIDSALQHIQHGLNRARELREKKPSWIRQSGPVVRGYRSKLDGTVQPYGLEVPASYDFDHPQPTRLDFWFHGRGEQLNETVFVQQRLQGGGQIAPPHTFVLHPYARFCNANKFAGEIDCLEALEHARQDYRIDPNRIVVRGFSMGGAAVWQFAVHYADRWAAAQPGAGFSETPDFLRTFQGETLAPHPWEEKLWRWYDCTGWAINLAQCPTIAYSGEIDRQIQAARMMEAAMERQGQKLVHLIGPQTGHKLHPETLAVIENRLENIVRIGRVEVPATVRFQTYTLRYPKMNWVEIHRLTEHWEPSRIEAQLLPPSQIEVQLSGVERFSLFFGPGQWPLDPVSHPAIIINGQEIDGGPIASDRSWSITLQRQDDAWQPVDPSAPAKLEKRHGLSGPIDDAFMDSFLFVKPSGAPFHEKTGNWAKSEMERAVIHWRQQMRGVARAKLDTEITDQDIRDHHLVLWGDPGSNAVLKKIIGNLPLEWTPARLALKKDGMPAHDPAKRSLIMIYPNPLNPSRYVVINSGFTYREYDYLNNARQTPKLPDWAIVDTSEAPGPRYPGAIPEAGFFGEDWEVK